MKLIKVILLMIFTTFIFLGCSSGKSDPLENKSGDSSIVNKYTDISPKEAKQRLDTEKGIVLLDVRTLKEYAEKRIFNSELIPLDVIESEAPVKLMDKNQVIFVYCRSGSRSVVASEKLVRMGYTKVYNLGGIINWSYETDSNK